MSNRPPCRACVFYRDEHPSVPCTCEPYDNLGDQASDPYEMPADERHSDDEPHLLGMWDLP